MKRIILTGTHQPHRLLLEEATDYEIVLAEAGQEVEILGGWKLNHQERHRIHVTIVHQAPQTRSTTTLRGVVSDAAQLTLQGTIRIPPDSQHCEAFLTENILLLSPRAQANAEPNLEIEANEVKCSHAATISHIDEDQLFYLESRAIPRQQAIDSIVSGFIAAVRPKNAIIPS